MKLILLIFAFGLVSSEPIPSYFGFNYHERVGIRQAALIKHAEEATDFDGSRIVGGTAAVAGRFPFMIGVAAFNHHESCQRGFPVGFTRVTTHLDWIKQFLLW